MFSLACNPLGEPVLELSRTEHPLQLVSEMATDDPSGSLTRRLGDQSHCPKSGRSWRQCFYGRLKPLTIPRRESLLKTF